MDGSLVPCRSRVEQFASGSECLVYNPARDEATALNPTATEVWNLCDGRTRVSEIAALLAQRYGVPDDALIEDIAEALSALQVRGLVEFPDDRGDRER